MLCIRQRVMFILKNRAGLHKINVSVPYNALLFHGQIFPAQKTLLAAMDFASTFCAAAYQTSRIEIVDVPEKPSQTISRIRIPEDLHSRSSTAARIFFAVREARWRVRKRISRMRIVTRKENGFVQIINLQEYTNIRFLPQSPQRI